jgi:hypothetical protein
MTFYPFEILHILNHIRVIESQDISNYN